jgi:alkylation response protein AidB-like acyl-CoA dehydrogenase
MFAKAITTYEPEHRRILRSNAEDFLAARAISEIRASAEERSFDRAFYQQLCDLGWVGMMQMSEGELDASDLVALHRELGRKVLPEPVLASGVMAAGILAEAANAAFNAQLEQLTSGETVATLAWQGASGGVDACDCGPVAQRGGKGWVIDGTARFVPWASKADAIIVAAKAEGGVLLGWLPAGTAGLSVHSATGVDKTEYSSVVLDGVVLADDAVIATPDKGAACLNKVLDLTRLAVSAEMVGAAEAVFKLTLDYLRERKQFGHAIGSFQVLQFAATEIFVQLELANSVLSSAARLYAEGDVQSVARIAACKSRCGDAAFMAARGAIQMHGAIGYTHECDVSLYVKRIMQLNAWLGSPARQRQRIRKLQPTPVRAAA